ILPRLTIGNFFQRFQHIGRGGNQIGVVLIELACNNAVFGFDLVPIGKPRSWCVGHDLLSALALAARTATSHSSEVAAQPVVFSLLSRAFTGLCSDEFNAIVTASFRLTRWR